MSFLVSARDRFTSMGNQVDSSIASGNGVSGSFKKSSVGGRAENFNNTFRVAAGASNKPPVKKEGYVNVYRATFGDNKPKPAFTSTGTFHDHMMLVGVGEENLNSHARYVADPGYPGPGSRNSGEMTTGTITTGFLGLRRPRNVESDPTARQVQSVYHDQFNAPTRLSWSSHPGVDRLRQQQQ